MAAKIALRPDDVIVLHQLQVRQSFWYSKTCFPPFSLQKDVTQTQHLEEPVGAVEVDARR